MSQQQLDEQKVQRIVTLLTQEEEEQNAGKRDPGIHEDPIVQEYDISVDRPPLNNCCRSRYICPSCQEAFNCQGGVRNYCYPIHDIKIYLADRRVMADVRGDVIVFHHCAANQIFYTDINDVPMANNPTRLFTIQFTTLMRIFDIGHQHWIEHQKRQHILNLLKY